MSGPLSRWQARARHGDAILVCAYVSVEPGSDFRRPGDVEHPVVAGTRLDCTFRYYDRLHRALARAHQQPNCPLEGGLPASQLARVAAELGHASCHTSVFFGCRPDSPCYLICYLSSRLAPRGSQRASGGPL